MPEIAVTECETAADVMRLAKQRAAWRQERYARPSELIQIVPEQEPAVERKLTIGGAPVKSALAIVLEYTRQIRELNRDALVIVPPPPPKRPSVSRIILETAGHFEVNVNDILSERRTHGVVFPRQIAMYIAKTLTLRTLPDIGRRIGGRDHTTVIHAIRKIQRLIASGDTDLANDIQAITARLGDANHA